MSKVYRIYVEKKKEFAVTANALFNDVIKNLQITHLQGIRILNRYDIEGINLEIFDKARDIIFSEPQVDFTYLNIPKIEQEHRIFAVEYLPGQFDQRADSMEQCIGILTAGDRPRVKSAQVYMLLGNLNDYDKNKIANYLINPVESREATLGRFETLEQKYDIPKSVDVIEGFIKLYNDELKTFIIEYGFAMDFDDIKFCQDYFKNIEKREPTITELRMIDTYWSDHCRHTTFLTKIEKAEIESEMVKQAYELYLNSREIVYEGKNKPITLMDIATIAMKRLKKEGKLIDLDESEEINACSVKVKVNIKGIDHDYLLMFKNETHNHPTEIEPFGGAATCLGGAIRDPLSGRSYVYQAMRITGCADPRIPVEDTMQGKLPQRKITVGAANGYSSYGNQIGLATGFVKEIYHSGYVAKRLEIGAVIGAVPAKNVIRETPQEGDVIILLGGKTGRDGCGGATGSSKSHTLESILSCGAEVQKGNPPEERKIQRLFRKESVTKLIKRCNDFGAGGISVAIGELADGLIIDLNAVPKKYEGLDGTELAISESQERMAVVVRKEDANKFISYANEENIEATLVAVVTKETRLKMNWNKKTIVNISREFLNSNGAEKSTNVKILNNNLININNIEVKGNDYKEKWLNLISDLNICSQKGLVERFDSTIGAGSVLLPYGGKNQLSEVQVMASKLPVLNGETNTCSVMAYGFNPYISEKSPFLGAVYSVVSSVSKLVSVGCSLDKMWLTMQEYFKRTKNDPLRWGMPFEALLGAMTAQLKLGIGAIGGKDSMSGSFEDIDVPPTLVSFAVSIINAETLITSEFKKAGSFVYLLKPELEKDYQFNFEKLLLLFNKLNKLIIEGKVLSCWAISDGGICEAITKMCLGNNIGFSFESCFDFKEVFKFFYGGFIVETDVKIVDAVLIGKTVSQENIIFNNVELTLKQIQKKWEAPLEEIFPVKIADNKKNTQEFKFNNKNIKAPSIKTAKPKVLIPVFPGTNCEYDTAKCFENAGAQCEIIVINNLNANSLNQSLIVVEKAISNSQIIMLPGGFSGGDEPDGSGKFICAFFRNDKLKEAINNLLYKRDGLMLGICNGFQALIKLGLVPYGQIREMNSDCPTLTCNSIGRHQSMMVRTKICSNLSPWFSLCELGEIHTVPISHGEGRFIASNELINKLALNGQIATQYVDLHGKPSMDISYNPNSSICAIEGITSLDGRILGKMAHSERIGDFVAKNIEGNKNQKIFESGVKYFK